MTHAVRIHTTPGATPLACGPLRGLYDAAQEDLCRATLRPARRHARHTRPGGGRSGRTVAARTDTPQGGQGRG